jgi:hypothetical protein
MKNLTSNKSQTLIHSVVFILISYFGFSVYLLDVKSVTGDDLSNYADAFDYGTFAAFAQARISMIFNAFLLPVPYLFDNHIYYKSVQIITNIASIVSIGAVLSTLLKNKYLWYVYSILALTLWQNSDGHNLMVSYPFYIAFEILTLSISSIFFIYYLRLEKNKYLVYSLILWILTSKGSEFYMLYFPLFFFIAFFESKKDLLLERTLETFRNIKWHILVTLLLFIAYVIFRVIVEVSYGGRTLSFDFFGFINSLLTYSFGLAPGVQAYFNFKNLPFSEFFRLIDLSVILVSSLVTFILIAFKEKIQTIRISGKYFYLVIFYLTLAPNLLISLTNKYQYYVSYHGVNNYSYSSFSFFTISVALILALMQLKKNTYYYFLVLVISIFVLLTQVNNKLIGSMQSHYSEKYFLLDALLDSSYLSDKKDGFTILAPTLWDKMTVVETETENYWIEDAWTKYAKRKNKENISIERYSSNNDASIEYFAGNKKDSSFMIYSENRKQKAIFLLSENCNKIRPCYWLTTNNSINGSVMHDAYIHNDIVYLAQTLSSPNQENFYGINSYQIKGELDAHQILMLTEYNSILKGQKVINFLEGFYTLEHDGVNHWIWAFDDGTINIRSPKNTKVEFSVSLRAASKRTILFKLNGKTIKENFVDNSHKNIKFTGNLTKGDNQLKIMTDSNAIKLSTSDERLFTYALFDISFEAID